MHTQYRPRMAHPRLSLVPRPTIQESRSFAARCACYVSALICLTLCVGIALSRLGWWQTALAEWVPALGFVTFFVLGLGE